MPADDARPLPPLALPLWSLIVPEKWKFARIGVPESVKGLSGTVAEESTLNVYTPEVTCA
jgi:hypothetical protein